MSQSQTTQQLVNKVNSIARDMGIRLPQRRRHSVLLWKTKRFAFGYTPWSDSSGSFYAIKYKTKGELLVKVKQVRFASRKVASKRAYKWFLQQKEREANYKPRPPKAEPKKPTSQDKLQKVQERVKRLQTKIKGLNTRLKKAKRTEKYYLKKVAEDSYKTLANHKDKETQEA